MPSGITINRGRAEMAYYGKTPWHGLGTSVDHAMTGDEVIEAAGLGWQVEMLPVYVQGEDGVYHEIPNRKASTRVDTGRVFGVMTDAFQPLQNVEGVAFLNALVATGEAVFHTAGSLLGGSRVWYLLRLPGDLRVSDRNVIEKYILLTNGHDGSMAVSLKLTGVQVVCANTMSMALSSGDTFRARHTRGIFDRVSDAREALGLAEAWFKMLMIGVDKMANIRVSEAEAKGILTTLYGPDLKAGEEPGPRIRTHIDQTMYLYRAGAGQELAEAKGTAFGVYNAVTDYVDHGRGLGQSQEKRLASIWYGTGDEIKRRAWSTLVPA
jgi:phage/plasmid-like protein (TIGR03299 family)